MLTYRGISVSTPDSLENAESHLESFKPFNVSQSIIKCNMTIFNKPIHSLGSIL